jgi:hypothetical protein
MGLLALIGKRMGYAYTQKGPPCGATSSSTSSQESGTPVGVNGFRATGGGSGCVLPWWAPRAYSRQSETPPPVGLPSGFRSTGGGGGCLLPWRAVTAVLLRKFSRALISSTQARTHARTHAPFGLPPIGPDAVKQHPVHFARPPDHRRLRKSLRTLSRSLTGAGEKAAPPGEPVLYGLVHNLCTAQTQQAVSQERPW